jgi:ferredoxin--NADP+ reductase
MSFWKYIRIRLKMVSSAPYLLTDLIEGDTVYISNRPNGLLTLNEVPEELPHLWVFATGTGVGPFLLILNSEEPWQRFEKIIVCYSVKTAEEMAYRENF